MKKFDVMKWLRSVRDAQYEEDKNLTDRQKIAKTKAAAKAFRGSRPKKRGNVGRPKRRPSL